MIALGAVGIALVDVSGFLEQLAATSTAATTSSFRSVMPDLATIVVLGIRDWELEELTGELRPTGDEDSSENETGDAEDIRLSRRLLFLRRL